MTLTVELATKPEVQQVLCAIVVKICANLTDITT